MAKIIHANADITSEIIVIAAVILVRYTTLCFEPKWKMFQKTCILIPRKGYFENLIIEKGN